MYIFFYISITNQYSPISIEQIMKFVLFYVTVLSHFDHLNFDLDQLDLDCFVPIWSRKNCLNILLWNTSLQYISLLVIYNANITSNIIYDNNELFHFLFR